MITLTWKELETGFQNNIYTDLQPLNADHILIYVKGQPVIAEMI